MCYINTIRDYELSTRKYLAEVFAESMHVGGERGVGALVRRESTKQEDIRLPESAGKFNGHIRGIKIE